MKLTRQNLRIAPLFKRAAVTFALCALAVAPTFAQEEEQPQEDGSGGITSRYYAVRAENYEKANSWEAAKREIDAGLEKYPDDPDLRYLNGRYYYYAQNDLNQARYNLVKALQGDDQNFGARRLMVDVEDDAQRYSSAICYINELLEFQPYDRDLWRRKIGLYNKIGHKVEADEALMRLARIYPNDSVVQRDLSNRHRADWASRLASSTLDQRASTIESWIDLDSHNLDYYDELIDIYRSMGDYDRALGAANRGLRWFPRNQNLVRKAVGILTEMGMLTRAMAFARENHLGGPIYDNLLREVVADNRLHDPYESSARLYLATNDADALTYLLNTALTRGYYDDAMVYLQEAYRKYGRTPELLMKEYTLEKRFGDEKGVMRVLKQITDAKLDVEGANQEYAAMIVELANREIDHEDYPSALEHLSTAIDLLWPSDELWASTVARKISLLGRMGRFAEARQTYYDALVHDGSNAPRFAAAYEEVAASRLKVLIEDEQYDVALKEAEELLKIMPNSEAALRTCINMAQTLKRDQLFYHYAALGYETFPDQPFFIVKQASALMQQGKPEEALAMLKPRPDDDYVNPQIYAAYAGITEEWAGLLLKERMPEQALEKIDAALLYDPSNKDLLYMKGIAYELLKEYGLAYEYQNKYYNPSNAEQAQWYQHMRYLKYRSFKHHVDATYLAAFYDFHGEESSAIAHLYSLASVSYSYLTRKNTYTGQISYKGVDGRHVENADGGGIGLEFLAQLDHEFNSRWSAMANISYGTKFFNKLGLNLMGSYNADHGWTPSLRLGYRLTPKNYITTESSSRASTFHVFLLTPAIMKSWERINTSLGVDLVVLSETARVARGTSFHYNVGWKGKLFFNEDNVSSVSLLAGFGSFPELTFFDQMAQTSLSRINAMLGFDVQYLFSSNFYMGLTGTWNTYNEGVQADSYRNVYSINVQLHIAF